jgi:hypothetical protein
MMFPQINCYHAGAIIPPHSFFIQSSGAQAGWPDLKPGVDSYIAVCPHQKYFEFYFWLVHGLYQSGKFKTCHRGSAIPFINLEDIRDTIREITPFIYSDWSRFQEILFSLDKLLQVKATLEEQVHATDNLQRTLLQQYFSEIKKAPK